MDASLKLQAGASEDSVARSIGHTSFGVTLRHYVDPAVPHAFPNALFDAFSDESSAGVNMFQIRTI